ncbi:MAG TPA: hypothetical protein VIV57_15035 [Anaeromyxobacter sp.]
MTSPARVLVALPTWGAARGNFQTTVRARPVRFGLRSSTASEAAGAALVLGGSVALWAAVLLAVW